MTRPVTLDIHNYPRMYVMAEAQVRTSTISDRSKDLIFAYRDTCLLQQTCGKVRLIRVMGVLLLAARTLEKDLDAATRDDLERLITAWMQRQPPYSPETLGTYKVIIKRFYTWLADPRGFSRRSNPPAIVSWINSHVQTKEKRRLQRNDLLTPEEIQRVITAARNLRDKALLSVLWETGGRIAEIGNRCINDVVPADVGYTIDVRGKTGARTPLVVSSAPLLAQWINNHPFKNDPSAPLWVHLGSPTPKLLLYAALRELIRDYFRDAGITKRVYPHLFRHSRATYCLATGLMTEAQAKAYFGWTPNSDQLATYAHLLASDANSAILRENNLMPKKETHDELRATKCYRCGEMNASLADYCTRCGAVLDLKKAYEHQQLHAMKEELFATMFRVMVEKGLIDDAARQIHDAGLGTLLKRLAKHATGETPVTSDGKQITVKETPPSA
jgi:integrase/recombinase XerD